MTLPLKNIILTDPVYIISCSEQKMAKILEIINASMGSDD